MIGAVLACGATGLAVTLWQAHGQAAPQSTAAAKVSLTHVERTDLATSMTLPGSLGFGSPQVLKGSGNGILTKLPGAGTLTARGKQLYRVDDRPVPVFYGDTPLFRELGKIGVVGHDVTVVKDNLAALGYDVGSDVGVTRNADGSTVYNGDTFTPALASAVKQWQKSLGLPATGKIGVGDVVVLPSQQRVSAVTAHVGDPVAEPLLSYTSPQKVITVSADPGQTSSVTAGESVTVTLPSGKEIPATVTSIAAAAQSSDDAAGGGSSPQTTLVVKAKHAADLAAYNATNVQVLFVSEVHKNVLTVPVGALLALSGGGFALQHPDGSLVRVKTGMFAGGLVEVSGAGITDGLAVEVAAS
jgi:peptidoglycan hydrolase-like protein with peptidoglycan-binding domain